MSHNHSSSSLTDGGGVLYNTQTHTHTHIYIYIIVLFLYVFHMITQVMEIILLLQVLLNLITPLDLTHPQMLQLPFLHRARIDVVVIMKL